MRDPETLQENPWEAPPPDAYMESFLYGAQMDRLAPNNPPTLFERDFGRVVVSRLD